MTTSTVTAEGHIAVPPAVRARLRLRPGSKVILEEQPNGDLLVRTGSTDAMPEKTGDIRQLRGMLRAPPGFAPTLEEIDEGIAQAIAQWNARAR